jgi:hypothetical protein
MFFVDYPYISDFLKKTVRDHAIPVVGTDAARQMGLYDGTRIISEERAVEIAREAVDPRIYMTSENSIGWISRHQAFSRLSEKISLFKNKLKFREMIRPLYPDFFFREIRTSALKTTRIDDIPLPFIIKPAVGFFSMGVYKVSGYDQWEATVDSILAELQRIRGRYPEAVLDAGAFIIEQCVEGDEYAVDAYFDSDGRPVILGILNHIFSSEADVADRVYMSSRDIIEKNLQKFTGFLEKLGELAGVKNFPVHAELRCDGNGTVLPIEVNPMRFGGWCSTPDLSAMAYGFNPYLYYYEQKKPDWPELLRDKDGRLFSIVVLDNSTGVDAEKITSFDYEKLLKNFEHPLELRKIDYKKYNVFAFLFTETAENHFSELENILNSDLRAFIST